MSGTIPPKLRTMIEELKSTDDLAEKYEILIEIGRGLPEIPEEAKLPEYLVHGCQSVVHVYSVLNPDGMIQFYGHADAMIVNGLLALLVVGLSGLSPQAFLAVSPDFIQDSGVVKSLTPSRVNGFYNIHQKMKADALRALGPSVA